VYSQFHQEFAKADPRRDAHLPVSAAIRRAQPPPRRLRGQAAHALASAAGRLDRDRAREAIA
jgi:hypothetical protein